MPIVDIKKVETEAKKKKDAIPEIITKDVGGKTYFKGKLVGAGDENAGWFDDYGECLTANQAEARKKEYEKLGLNEDGQSPEQVLLAKKTGELRAKRAKLLEEVKEIDAEIAALVSQVRTGKAKDKEKKKK